MSYIETSMTKYVQSNGITIAYKEFGSGEPLILLMGLGSSGDKWIPHIKAYQEHFHVYAVDNRGAGYSDKPVAYAYSIEDMARDTIGLMDALGITAAHFNGISMGGAIAQYIAVHYPQRVCSLILTNTFPRCNVSFRRAIEILREAHGQMDTITYGRLLQWMIYAQPFMEEHEDTMIAGEQINLRDSSPMPSYAFKAQCNAILNFDERKNLSKISAPVLVVAGDKDSFVPVYLTMEMVNAIPGAKLYMVQNGGHVQHFEQTEKYNQVTMEFLLNNKAEESVSS